jgi:hypothetical protein
MSATSDEPWQIVEDTRCVATDGAYLDENGDYYVRGGACWGYFAAFGPDAASNRACVLRVRAGERSFDPARGCGREALAAKPVGAGAYSLSRAPNE